MKRWWHLSVLFLTIFSSFQCFAFLGGDASSAQNDCAVMSGKFSINGGTLTCTTTKYVVREILNSNNVIAQVNWQGSATPPLRVLAALHKLELEPASQTAVRVTHRSRLFESQSLLIHRAGNARKHFGSILLKSEVGK